MPFKSLKYAFFAHKKLKSAAIQNFLKNVFKSGRKRLDITCKKLYYNRALNVKRNSLRFSGVWLSW
ncbi:MAG TPA: hypothetical protein DDY77_04725 [Clostridiales bacterium]|nr:hypothetical protein [Clostridiales bacterium]